MMTLGLQPAITPGGRSVAYTVRHDTNDSALVVGILSKDEYNLGRLGRLSGWAIDIGAHIGTVAVALAVDNPGLQVVAVEALPENVEVMRETVARNRLAERVHVISGAAGSEAEVELSLMVPISYGWTRSVNQSDSYVHGARFIGGMVPANETSQTVQCPVWSIGSICATFGIDEVAFLKMDCEGCEWFVLTSPTVARVRRISGEMHTSSHGSAPYLHALLDPTHDVVIAQPELNVTLFEAVRRD